MKVGRATKCDYIDDASLLAIAKYISMAKELFLLCCLARNQCGQDSHHTKSCVKLLYAMKGPQQLTSLSYFKIFVTNVLSRFHHFHLLIKIILEKLIGAG